MMKRAATMHACCCVEVVVSSGGEAFGTTRRSALPGRPHIRAGSCATIMTPTALGMAAGRISELSPLLIAAPVHHLNRC